MTARKKTLEWILRNHHNGKMELTPRPVHHEHIAKYLNDGFRIVMKTEDFIRLDRKNDFIIYDVKHKYATLEYYHK